MWADCRAISRGVEAAKNLVAINDLAPDGKNRPVQIFCMAVGMTGHAGLLDLDGCASFFQLALDFLGLFLGNTFLYRLWCPFDEVLGFFQSETGDSADFLDHIDLGSTNSGEDDIKFCLFLSCSTGVTATSRHGHCYGSSGGGNAPLFFQKRSGW